MALSLGMASCDVLDVTPIDPGTVMKVDANGLMNKCYANMAIAGQQGPDDGDCDVDGLDGGTTGFVRQLWNANELPTDEAMCCWGDDGISSFNFNQYTSSHPMLQGFYYRLYTGIDYCNHYLEKCADYDATMTAEARFLRAMYYYHLMDCFGNVPFTEVISSECPKQIKRADLFKYIEKELLEIEPNLLEAEARTTVVPTRVPLGFYLPVCTSMPRSTPERPSGQRLRNMPRRLSTQSMFFGQTVQTDFRHIRCCSWAITARAVLHARLFCQCFRTVLQQHHTVQQCSLWLHAGRLI